MYLKSLTLRGFKSFASSTTLQFEPGVTCIVGPNGSGKSNVVDALAWVMGEQGYRSLRGAKMEDVIFAGTTARGPLGRAEVVLTIDNSDGALPVEYAEVTISRTMFRGGGSEYAINRQPCRLLDVQELLSDSGIGQEMHVIVGQGRLDEILHASPEDRRGFIEEAAGVLKHRKRKERALRKLEATESNLTRLSDLHAEIRRQLKPLGRQAEVARRAAAVQLDARDARARLLADDVVALQASLARDLADEEVVRARRSAAQEALGRRRQDAESLAAALGQDGPRLDSAQQTWYALAGMRERLGGTAALAAERLRAAADDEEEGASGRDPAELERAAAEAAASQQQLDDEVATLRAALEEAVEARRRAEAAHQQEQERVAELLRTAADRREGLARLAGEVSSVLARSAAADEEVGRLGTALTEARARADRAQHELTALETRVAGLDSGEVGLDAQYEAAVASLDDLADRTDKLRGALQAAERQRAALAARHEALSASLVRQDGASALLAAGAQVPGVLGSVAALLDVRPGYEVAVSAALGSSADAVAVRDLEAAIGAIDYLKDSGLGRAEVLVGDWYDEGSDDGARPALPDGAAYLLDVVSVPTALASVLRRLLRTTVVVPDLVAARALVADRPGLVAVTTEGDLLSDRTASGGSSPHHSAIEAQAAVDDAGDALAEATSELERMRFEESRLTAERQEAQLAVDSALARLHESDASMSALAEQLAHLGSVVRSARAECTSFEEAIASATAARESAVTGLAELERRLELAKTTDTDEPPRDERDWLGEQERGSRQLETEARLALRTVEERSRALRWRADALLRSAAEERAARDRARARQEQRAAEALAARAVSAAVRIVLDRLEQSLARADERARNIQAERAERERELNGCTDEVRALEEELARLTDSVHRDEMLRAEHRLRMEQVEQRAVDELALDLDTLVTEYGPDVLVPAVGPGPAPAVEPVETPAGAAEAAGFETAAARPPQPAAGDQPEGGDQPAAGRPYVRAEQERRLRSAERALAELGRVNPLALEEFAALEERHAFLTGQLDDLRRTRADLLGIVRDVDTRVREVLAAAYADVADRFGETFARLFPGGEGRLVLTDPDNLLLSGVEIEARPPGKKVKRLSLLSGGERSLVAVAFLVALFLARPSPFYVLDEVEAALDDINLRRLLDIYEELRGSSQLLVITHHKYTMEVADALYGVTMRGDGVSAVISQRLRDRVHSPVG